MIFVYYIIYSKIQDNIFKGACNLLYNNDKNERMEKNFVMRSNDELALRQAADILSREINRDQVLKDAMDSEEVKKELEFSTNISNAVSLMFFV